MMTRYQVIITYNYMKKKKIIIHEATNTTFECIHTLNIIYK